MVAFPDVDPEPTNAASPPRGDAAPTRSGRAADELRAISVDLGVNRYAEGSAHVVWGHTEIRATVTDAPGLPRHLRGTSAREGWLMAEYALLPRATHERTLRERRHASGRTHEIQRLIGRALRSAVALEHFRNHTLTVDLDVLQADGGTRCAAILAGWAALHDLADRRIRDGTLDEWPLTDDVAAVSVGLVGGEVRIDLDYAEDAAASADLNVVATADGRIVEVQGGTEGRPIDAERYVQLVAAGVTAAQRVSAQAKSSLA